MKYLYFRLSGGEYHDDMVGVVEISPEFLALVERGRKAVQACRDAFYPTQEYLQWFGEVCHRSHLFSAFDACKLYEECGIDDEQMFDEGSVLLDTAPPDDEWDGRRRIENVVTTFDNQFIVFSCYAKHGEYQYVSGPIPYDALTQEDE